MFSFCSPVCSGYLRTIRNNIIFSFNINSLQFYFDLIKIIYLRTTRNESPKLLILLDNILLIRNLSNVFNGVASSLPICSYLVIGFEQRLGDQSDSIQPRAVTHVI